MGRCRVGSDLAPHMAGDRLASGRNHCPGAERRRDLLRALLRPTGRQADGRKRFAPQRPSGRPQRRAQCPQPQCPQRAQCVGWLGFRSASRRGACPSAALRPQPCRGKTGSAAYRNGLPGRNSGAAGSRQGGRCSLFVAPPPAQPRPWRCNCVGTAAGRDAAQRRLRTTCGRA